MIDRRASFGLGALLAAALAGPGRTQSPPQPHEVAPGFREPDPIDFDADDAGFQPIFNGTDLTGWDGDPRYWRAEDGAIVGESSKDNPVSNAYIVYQPLTAKNFDLKFEIKVEKGGGSGFQYRSQTGLPWRGHARADEPPYDLNRMLTGPQADFWYPVTPMHSAFTGQFYSENNPLGILAWRGQVTEHEPGRFKRLVGAFADREALGGYVRTSDWNQYEVIARGGVFIHIINGRLMAVCIDDDPASVNNLAGKFGIELESLPSKVSVRRIRVRRLADG
jgi:hypothetical protein